MNVFMLVSEYPTVNNCVPNIFVHNLAKALAAKGTQVSVLWLDLRSARHLRRFGLSSYEIDGIRVFRYAFPCGPFVRLASMLSGRLAPRLYRYAVKRAGKPDLIHAHFGTMAYAASVIHRKWGVPYIETEHSSSLLAPVKVDRVRHVYYKRGYAEAKQICAVSGALAAAVRTLTGTPVSVIPNIVSDAFSPSVRVAKSPFVFVSTARLIRGKGFELLLDAAAALSSEGADFRLRIIGDGVLRSDLCDRAAKSGILDKVEFLGQKTAAEINEIYAGADAFVLPSEVETFGVVYIEAGAAGLPVIATDCGGPSDIVTEETGLLIPSCDKDALLSAMRTMLVRGDGWDRARISESIRSRFGSDAVVGRYQTVYEEILS